MKNNQFKIPENAQIHENFRTWKSGKQWLYASSILALVVSGGAIASSSHGVFADQVLSTSTGKTTGADNTATGGLGSNATAGADNASVANSANTAAKSSANPSSYTDAQVNSSSAVLKQDNNSGNPIGVPEVSNSQNTNGTGGATTIGINSSSTASSGGTINTTSSTNLNSNGAVTAGSGAASQTTVDIKATQSLSNSGSTLSDGSYSWTISPSTDQTQAGYSVAAVTITTPGTDSGQSSAGGATAQLAGGTYTKLTSGQPSSGNFTATSTANTITASSVAANNSMIDALRKSNASLESAYYSETAVLISDGATTVLSSLASNVSSAFALVSAVATTDNLLTYSSAYSLLSATLTSIQASYTASSLLALQNMSSAGSYAIAASNATTMISSASSVVSSANSTASVASSNAISNSSEMNKQSAFSVAAIGANSAGLTSYTSSATSTFNSQVAAGQSAANLATTSNYIWESLASSYTSSVASSYAQSAYDSAYKAAGGTIVAGVYIPNPTDLVTGANTGKTAQAAADADPNNISYAALASSYGLIANSYSTAAINASGAYVQASNAYSSANATMKAMSSTVSSATSVATSATALLNSASAAQSTFNSIANSYIVIIHSESVLLDEAQSAYISIATSITDSIAANNSGTAIASSVASFNDFQKSQADDFANASAFASNASTANLTFDTENMIASSASVVAASASAGIAMQNSLATSYSIIASSYKAQSNTSLAASYANIANSYSTIVSSLATIQQTAQSIYDIASAAAATASTAVLNNNTSLTSLSALISAQTGSTLEFLELGNVLALSSAVVANNQTMASLGSNNALTTTYGNYQTTQDSQAIVSVQFTGNSAATSLVNTAFSSGVASYAAAAVAVDSLATATNSTLLSLALQLYTTQQAENNMLKMVGASNLLIDTTNTQQLITQLNASQANQLMNSAATVAASQATAALIGTPTYSLLGAVNNATTFNLDINGNVTPVAGGTGTTQVTVYNNGALYNIYSEDLQTYQLNALMDYVVSVGIPITGPTFGSWQVSDILGLSNWQDITQATTAVLGDSIAQAATQAQQPLSALINALLSYQQTVNAAQTTLDGLATNAKAVVKGTNGIYTQSILAPVTMNTDGTLTINADGISYTTAVSQNIANIMSNLISQATLAANTVSTLPIAVSTAQASQASTKVSAAALSSSNIAGLMPINLSGAVSNAIASGDLQSNLGVNLAYAKYLALSGALALYGLSTSTNTASVAGSYIATAQGNINTIFQNMLNTANNATGSVAADTSAMNVVTQSNGILSGASSAMSVAMSSAVQKILTSSGYSATGLATVAVGLTFNDPTDQILENLKTPNYYYEGQSAATTDRQLDNTFIPETTVISANALGAVQGVSAAPGQTQYTSIVYQVNTNDIQGVINAVTADGTTIGSYTYDKYAGETVSAPTISGYGLVAGTASSATVDAAGSPITFTYESTDPSTGQEFTGSYGYTLAYEQGEILPAGSNQTIYSVLDVWGADMPNSTQEGTATLYADGKAISTINVSINVNKDGESIENLFTFSGLDLTNYANAYLTSTFTVGDPLTGSSGNGLYVSPRWDVTQSTASSATSIATDVSDAASMTSSAANSLANQYPDDTTVQSYASDASTAASTASSLASQASIHASQAQSLVDKASSEANQAGVAAINSDPNFENYRSEVVEDSTAASSLASQALSEAQAASDAASQASSNASEASSYVASSKAGTDSGSSSGATTNPTSSTDSGSSSGTTTNPTSSTTTGSSAASQASDTAKGAQIDSGRADSYASEASNSAKEASKAANTTDSLANQFSDNSSIASLNSDAQTQNSISSSAADKASSDAKEASNKASEATSYASGASSAAAAGNESLANTLNNQASSASNAVQSLADDAKSQASIASSAASQAKSDAATAGSLATSEANNAANNVTNPKDKASDYAVGAGVSDGQADDYAQQASNSADNASKAADTTNSLASQFSDNSSIASLNSDAQIEKSIASSAAVKASSDATGAHSAADAANSYAQQASSAAAAGNNSAAESYANQASSASNVASSLADDAKSMASIASSAASKAKDDADKAGAIAKGITTAPGNGESPTNPTNPADNSSVTLPGQDGKLGTPDDVTVISNGKKPLQPGADGSVTLPDGGGTVKTPDGTYNVPGGTVVDPDGTIHLPGGSVVNPGGKITLPGNDGKPNTGDEVTVTPNGKDPVQVGPGGSITLPGGGTVTTPGGTITVPGGTVVDPDGTIHLPGGSVVDPGGKITLPGNDGKPNTGDEVTVTPNGKDPVQVGPGGSITLPGGGTVTTPKGTFTVPDGTVVDPDGTIHLPNGEIIYPDGTTSGQNISGATSKHTQNSTVMTLGNPVSINPGDATLPKTGDDDLNSAEALVLGLGTLLGVFTLTEVKRRKEN
ncbi:KxYKxGKxW signal peptide domain-containing protein [Lactococcus lactis]|uniref:KxYKxGKxW signal peptide domain-containing protein n=1 Tax=Lactococcus lactis TaxID=1358 RepID=UPI001F532E4E|nr:KxYKxGKxW signal peptide domain-containing protein [Lactococcus lactis]MCI1070521.1 KxYKxGKxW signal peptide domain-containing protein [Lactococcus lactis]